MSPWTGKRVCNVPGDNRVFMTYAEFEAALETFRARRLELIRQSWLNMTPIERELILGN